MRSSSACRPRGRHAFAGLIGAVMLMTGGGAYAEDALAPLIAKAKQEGAISIFMGTARYPESAEISWRRLSRRNMAFPSR